MGKWIGAFLGLLSGGTLGAIAGFVFGALFDTMTKNGIDTNNLNEDEKAARIQQGERNGFLFSLMVLIAHIVHSDGRIMHSEMEFVRRFLRTNFSVDAEKEGEAILLKLFERKKGLDKSSWDNQIMDVCRQIRDVMSQEHRLQLIALLCEVAKADGSVVPEERLALMQICKNMGIDPKITDQMLQLGGDSVEEAYHLLGINPDASNDDVRRAYKKLALQYHPDRVAYLGEDVRRVAEKKFQQINEAKDRIFKTRGMK